MTDSDSIQSSCDDMIIKWPTINRELSDFDRMGGRKFEDCWIDYNDEDGKNLFSNEIVISLDTDYIKYHELLSKFKHCDFIMAKMKNDADFIQYMIMNRATGRDYWQKNEAYLHGWNKTLDTFCMIGWWRVRDTCASKAATTNEVICELWSNKKDGLLGI